MPTITLHRQTFEKLVGKKLTTEQLKEKIPMIGTALEGITDKEIVVEVFPNRPDMLSEQGFARAFRSFLGVKTGLALYTVKRSGCKVIVDSVPMRPFTACAIVKNLKFDDERIREVMQIQEKLATTHGRNRKKSEYGVYPLDRVKFPITYKALDPNNVSFQPLGFDKPIKASLIADQHPKGKEYKHITTGWKKYPFFVDADENIMAMIPFTNSQDTGRITEKTRDVFVECDGTDLKNVTVALHIIVAMLADMGGDVYSVDVVYSGKPMTMPDFTPRKMKLEFDYVNKRLGTDLSEKDVKKCLAQMGYDLKGNDVLVPVYRADILHQSDFVEDVAIAYGYDNITPTVPSVATIAQEDPLQRFKAKLIELFIGLQFQEVTSYHLMAHTELSSMMMKPAREVVHLKNALVDYGCMRNSIVPSLLKILAQNQHNDYPQNVVEFGRTFHHDKNAMYGIREDNTLAFACSGENVDFTTVRRVIDTLLKSLRVEGMVKEVMDASLIPGRAAELYVGKKKIAVLGEVHPAVLEQWNIAMPVAVAEIDVGGLFGLIGEL